MIGEHGLAFLCAASLLTLGCSIGCSSAPGGGLEKPTTVQLSSATAELTTGDPEDSPLSVVLSFDARENFPEPVTYGCDEVTFISFDTRPTAGRIALEEHFNPDSNEGCLDETHLSVDASYVANVKPGQTLLVSASYNDIAERGLSTIYQAALDITAHLAAGRVAMVSFVPPPRQGCGTAPDFVENIECFEGSATWEASWSYDELASIIVLSEDGSVAVSVVASVVTSPSPFEESWNSDEFRWSISVQYGRG